MKLQTKIVLFVVPLVLLSIFTLGLWSLQKAKESVHESTFLYMNTVLDGYMSKITKMNHLLVKNNLDTVDSFLRQYQQETFKAGRNLDIPEKSYLFIMDVSGRLVFCSDNRDTAKMEKNWAKVARKAEWPSDSTSGYHMMDTDEEQLYVARQFNPWDWVIFFSMEDKVVHAAENEIHNATMIIAGLCSFAAIAIIIIVFRTFFAIPVKRLSEAAALITQGEKVKTINVTSTDELGDLARKMETMSHFIQKYQADIIKSHDELEQKVKERTMELETALSKIKTLKGLVPICMHCKKIRDDQGYWNQIEAYIQKYSEAEFSHSICKECADELYPDMDLYDD